MTLAALSFKPTFLYGPLGLAGVIAFSRLLLRWADEIGRETLVPASRRPRPVSRGLAPFRRHKTSRLVAIMRVPSSICSTTTWA